MEKARKGTPQYEEWLRKYKEKRKASTASPKKEVAEIFQNKKKFSLNDVFASLGDLLPGETMQKSGKVQQKYKDWLASYNTRRNKSI